MEITNITSNAVNKYFNSLAELGYSNKSNICRLVALSFIEELLTGELSYFINEKDYLSIVNAIYCISGDCFIPLPSFILYDDVYRRPSINTRHKVTEDNVFRSTENLLLKII